MEVKEQLSIALVQYDIVWESAQENHEKIEAMLENYHSDFAILIFPEALSTGFSMNSEKIAEPVDGSTFQWMKNLAVRKNIVVCGSFFVSDNGRYYNRFFWVEPGERVFTYDKHHLFTIEGEIKSFSPGKSRTLIDFKGWKIFPQICYDLRFPVWSRNVFSYDLMINVANWPASRSEVWKTLLKARAIENQCYVVAVNRVGTDGNKIVHSGDSLVVDPKGIKIYMAGDREIIETVTIDLNRLHAFRDNFNTLKDMDHFTIDS